MIRLFAVLACLMLLLASPARAASPMLPMTVTLHPKSLWANTRNASVEVVTAPRVVCVAFVLYDNGLLPLTFQHARTLVTSSRGVAVWSWSDPPRAPGGTASVSCTSGSTTRTVNVHFRVLANDAPHAAAHASDMPPFSLRTFVAPNPITGATALATLLGYTSTGARCVAGIFYSDGTNPRTFAGLPRDAVHGVVSWRWRIDTRDIGGTATITCVFRVRTITATTLFTIKHP